MNFKIIFPLFLLVFFVGCKQLESQKKIIQKEPDAISEPKIINENVTSKPSDEIEEDSSKYT